MVACLPYFVRQRALFSSFSPQSLSARHSKFHRKRRKQRPLSARCWTHRSTVPNALVVLQGLDERRTFVTGDNGFFSFEEVKAGTPVRVQVSAPDLKSWSSNEIILQPGQSFIVTDISLGVATVQTAVNAATPEQVAVEQVKIQEQQRVLGVIPNFYVTYEHDPAPLTSKLKFQLATKALTDPVTIAGFGLNAAIYQAAGYPSYGQGWGAYGQRLGATFAGGYTKILLGDAVFASLAAPGSALLLSRNRHHEISPAARLVNSVHYQGRRWPPRG